MGLRKRGEGSFLNLLQKEGLPTKGGGGVPSKGGGGGGSNPGGNCTYPENKDCRDNVKQIHISPLLPLCSP